MEECIEKVKEALTYYNHRNYEAALEIFSEILPILNQDTETYASVLLEYALCLLDKATFDIEKGYKKLLDSGNRCGISPEEQEQIEEDIEICWDSLEHCRVSFSVVNDKGRLCRTHKALGDVYALNNDFESAIKEYTKAITFAETKDIDTALRDSIAEAYRNLGQHKKAIEIYKDIIKRLMSSGNKELAKEYEDTIEAIKILEQAHQTQEPKKESASEPPKNIDHLKRKND